MSASATRTAQRLSGLFVVVAVAAAGSSLWAGSRPPASRTAAPTGRPAPACDRARARRASCSPGSASSACSAPRRWAACGTCAAPATSAAAAPTRSTSAGDRSRSAPRRATAPPRRSSPCRARARCPASRRGTSTGTPTARTAFLFRPSDTPRARRDPRCDRAAAGCGSARRPGAPPDRRAARRCPIRVGAAVRLVAAMMRVSMWRARTPPTGDSIRSCVKRSSFVCSSGAISPISSRNSVPPSACSMMPGFAIAACECAPRA